MVFTKIALLEGHFIERALMNLSSFTAHRDPAGLCDHPYMTVEELSGGAHLQMEAPADHGLKPAQHSP